MLRATAQQDPPGKRRPAALLIGLGILGLLVLGMFSRVLFLPGPIVPAHPNTDLSQQYLHWRNFGFTEMQHGKLALWNPHIFSGAPFFGGFQAALLYPPNLIFLILPLAKAVSWSIALHVWMAGAFTFLWAWRRGLQTPAAFLAGVVMMFCGAHSWHVFAGHLTHLCTMIWAPLLFLVIDGFFETGSLKWCFPGMATIAMQVLAGYPQYVYFTGAAATVYSALCWSRSPHRPRFALGLALMVAGGVGLGAVQLFTGIQAWKDMARGPGLTYQIASSFSFPPENLVTLFVPEVFGNINRSPYWGRCYLWEMSLCVGAAATVLATLGAIWGDTKTRRFSLMMALLFLLLALGGHTPLFKLLYYCLPAFNKFRGSSKFILIASMFIAMLAAIGFNELLKGRVPTRRSILSVGIVALVLAGAGLGVRFSGLRGAGSWWHLVLTAVRNTNETYLQPDLFDTPSFISASAAFASRSLLLCAASFTIIAVLLYWLKQTRDCSPGAGANSVFTRLVCLQPVPVWLLLAMSVGELCLFAHRSLAYFDITGTVNPPLASFIRSNPGDYRILNIGLPNEAMSMGARDLWGYDAGIPLRYSQLISFTQGADPDEFPANTKFTLDHPLLGMLRCRFIFSPENDQTQVFEITNRLPQLVLVQNYRILRSRHLIFSALGAAAFDPRQQVILENEPVPVPVPAGPGGMVKLIDSSTDHLTIAADIPAPSILLVTDTYASGWTARGLPGSAQQQYTIQPANWCLRAVPLSAGHHLFRMEYLPTAFTLGKWVSLVCLAAFLLTSVVVFGPLRAKRGSPIRQRRMLWPA